VGHLFQGRFKALVVEDDAGWQEVARYVHLNPVRVAGLKLDKRRQAASRAGLVSKPAAALVAGRLQKLREYRWSSYRGYAGYGRALVWVCQEPLDRLCGGVNSSERRAALREYTEAPVRQGAVERPWDRLVAGLVLGSETFARSLRQKLRGNRREQKEFRALAQPVRWSAITSALEEAKGESWDSFRNRHGGWRRDAALWLGRRRGRLSLAQLGEAAGNDDWEVRYFGRIGVDPNADPDGDGMSNYQEYLAGTNPTNRASCLRISALTANGDDLVVTWTTVGGRSYTLQTNSTANGGFRDFTPAIFIPGTGEGVTNFVDPKARAAWPLRYYRIRLAQ
jgi:hypothetical protein